MNLIQSGKKLWFNQIKKNRELNAGSNQLMFIDMDSFFSSIDSTAARSESSSLYPKFTLQNYIWRNVRYFRQIRCHPTDTSVSIIIFHWLRIVTQTKIHLIFKFSSGNTPETRGTAFVVYEDIFDAKNACDHLSGFNVCNRYLVVLYYQSNKAFKRLDVDKKQEELNNIKNKYNINTDELAK